MHAARRWQADVSAALWWLIPLWLVLVFVLAALLFQGFERSVTRWREHLTRAVPAGPFGRG
jgi:peptidoglycan/LPS O-acetylase OafA/YrhL